MKSERDFSLFSENEVAVEEGAAGPGESYAADDPHVDDGDERHAGAEGGRGADQEPETTGAGHEINLKSAPLILGPMVAFERLHAVHLPQLREPHEQAANDEAPGTKARRIERRYNEDAAQQVQQAADGTQEEVSAPKVTGFAVTGA